MRLPILFCALAALVACGGPGANSGPEAQGDAATLDGSTDGSAHDGGGDAGGGSDAGQGDAATGDAGTDDAGSSDAGPGDAGAGDAGAGDAGGGDAGSNDAGTSDAGPVDDVISIEGYGAATRGGWQDGHDVVLVTSLDDSGPGTLRDALASSTGPRIIRFALDGTIHLATSLLLPSDLTIDGRGRAITIADKGLIIPGTHDVILTHLTLDNAGPKSEDGLRIGDPTLGITTRVAVDHVTFRHSDGRGFSKYTDEALSVVWGATDITIAWCRIEDWEKVFLFGNGDAPQSLDSTIRVTVHHTYTHDTGRRHPQARYGTYDFFDNFFDGWQMWGSACADPYPDAFGMLCQDSCKLRAENNSFARTRGSLDGSGIPYVCPTRVDDATVCETFGVIEELGSAIAPGNAVTLKFGVGCAARQSVPRPYAVTLDPADETLRTRLRAQAGNVP